MKTKAKTARRGVPGYSNFGGAGPFAPMDRLAPAREKKKAEQTKRGRKLPRRRVPKRLPTLKECEKALGEKASAWIARCYEISCRIVAAGLVDGEAVYGHWIGDVATESHFADRGKRLPFVQHGWILLKDGRVLDPTRWVFENVEPYLYIGEEPDSWAVIPCANCGLLREEHRDGGPDDQCEMYEQERWPYDEGGNVWREAMTRGQSVPIPKGPRKPVALSGWTASWVAAVFGEQDAKTLAVNQLFYLANLPYQTIKQAVGPDGLKAIYDAICDFDETAISFIPRDNANLARHECGFDRVFKGTAAKRTSAAQRPAPAAELPAPCGDAIHAEIVSEEKLLS